MDTLNLARRPQRLQRPQGQQGFVLILALVIVVIITLSAVAMIASLRSSISASGNIAFRQAATRAADVAVEDAFQWVRTQMTASATSLNNNVSAAAGGGLIASRYYATFLGLDSFDAGCMKDSAATAFTPQNYRFSDTVNGGDGNPCAAKLAATPSGYSLYYVVHRMAQTVGSSCPAAGCSSPSISPASGVAPGCSYDPSSPAYCGVTSSVNNLVYYRITVKVVGPRQNNRYIQAFIY